MNSSSAAVYSRSHVVGSTKRRRPLTWRALAARVASSVARRLIHSPAPSGALSSSSVNWTGLRGWLILVALLSSPPVGVRELGRWAEPDLEFLSNRPLPPKTRVLVCPCGRAHVHRQDRSSI